LNELDDETYEAVTDEADQLEYETWMLQAGSALWRRLLAVTPEPCDLPRLLMHVSRLEPEQLEHLMITVIERPDYARDLLTALGEE